MHPHVIEDRFVRTSRERISPLAPVGTRSSTLLIACFHSILAPEWHYTYSCTIIKSVHHCWQWSRYYSVTFNFQMFCLKSSCNVLHIIMINCLCSPESGMIHQVMCTSTIKTRFETPLARGVPMTICTVSCTDDQCKLFWAIPVAVCKQPTEQPEHTYRTPHGHKQNCVWCVCYTIESTS